MNFRILPLLLVTCLAFLFLTSCPVSHYQGNFLNITSCKLGNVKWKRTPQSIRVWAPPAYLTPEFFNEIDKKTAELETCFKTLALGLDPSWKIQRDWFAIYVPEDWYTSTCSPEQLIPSRVDYKLCESKGLTIPPHCRQVVVPTKACPCPCNARAAIQNNWVIVTAPNLKLLKAELSRLVLWPKYNMPWVDPVSQCLQ